MCQQSAIRSCQKFGMGLRLIEMVEKIKTNTNKNTTSSNIGPIPALGTGLGLCGREPVLVGEAVSFPQHRSIHSGTKPSSNFSTYPICTVANCEN